MVCSWLGAHIRTGEPMRRTDRAVFLLKSQCVTGMVSAIRLPRRQNACDRLADGFIVSTHRLPTRRYSLLVAGFRGTDGISGTSDRLAYFLPQKWAWHAYKLRYTLIPSSKRMRSTRERFSRELDAYTYTPIYVSCGWAQRYGRANQ